jgi:hypothetical protein
LRGLVLLAVALLIGIVLLNATDGDPPGTNLSTNPATRSEPGDTPSKGSSATTTTVPPTTTVPARAPKDVKVIVANASAVKGAAGKVNEGLKPLGYNVLAPANAATAPASSVYFTPGYDREAAAIAAALAFPATAVKPLPAPSPVADIKGANVVVVIGADQAARFGAAGATTTSAKAGATTTTAKAGATTTTAKAGATTTAPATTTTKKP